jgi:hypothetical protein
MRDTEDTRTLPLVGTLLLRWYGEEVSLDVHSGEAGELVLRLYRDGKPMELSQIVGTGRPPPPFACSGDPSTTLRQVAGWADSHSYAHVVRIAVAEQKSFRMATPTLASAHLAQATNDELGYMLAVRERFLTVTHKEVRAEQDRRVREQPCPFGRTGGFGR